MQTIADHERWLSGYGLGLGLSRDGDRILAGHGGSMPGFIAGVYVSPARQGRRRGCSRTRARRDLGELAIAARRRRRSSEWPVAPEPWRVGEPPPDDVVPLLGIWFMEATQVVFRWRDGKLEARFAGDAGLGAVRRVSSARRDDRWRIVSGWSRARRSASSAARTASVERLVLGRLPGHARRPAPWRVARVAPTRTAALRARSAAPRGAPGRSPRASPTMIAATAKTISCADRQRERR